MAIISSYPTIIPQLADKLIGSNNVDSYGDPVQGTPTVQYTLTSVKSLVDQNFIEQINTSRPTSYTVLRNNVGEPLIFGTATIGGSSTNVKYDHTDGKIIFNKVGTYRIQQLYLGSSPAAANNPYVMFKIVQNGLTQVGPTVTDRWYAGANANRHRISVETIVNITTAATYYYIWSCSPTDGADAVLSEQVSGGFGTNTPSAQLIISKLI